MKITYDPSVDAAYIQLMNSVVPGQAIAQSPTIPTPGNGGEVILDFDAAGLLLGIEVLNAASVLPPEVLATAIAPGGS